MSATPESTLANPEQRIADLERQLAEREAELAECKAERDAARDQQTATDEVLQVINSSLGDLTPVFEAMLGKAMTLCEAAFGMLWSYDGDCFRMLAHHGLPVALQTFMQRPFRSPPEGSGLRRLLDGEALVQHVDIAAEPLPTTRGNRAALVELGGARAQLEVALRKDDELLGVFHVYRREVRPFTDKQIALLQNFAAQAVIAMENARLLTETRQALEQQTATAEVLGVINASPGDLVPVFDAILEKATQLCEAPFGVLRTWDGERFHVIAAQGDPEFTEWVRGYGPFAPAGPSSGPARA